MNFFESIKIAAASLWARKTRSALSILGIVVGILTVASLLSVALGVKQKVTKSIESLGSNLVAVVPGKIEKGGTPNFLAALGASTLTEQDYDAIRAAAPEAKNVAMAMLVTGTVRAGDTSLNSAIIFAASPGIEQAFNVRRGEGRFFDTVDETQRARTAVLGATAAKQLFPAGSALNKTIAIRGEEFTIVGVLEAVVSASGFGGPDVNSFVMMPLRTGWDLTGTKQVFRIMMQAPDAESISALADKVKQTLLGTHRGEEDFSVLTQEDLLGFVSTIFDILTAMLSAIAAISLLVGGIGIMNIMLVSVSERTREIGIRKAVGATRGAILLQFLVESVMLTFLGGIIAIGLFVVGIPIAKAQVPSLPVELNVQVLLLALGFSALVGIIFGIVPAYRASQKHPIEALRAE